MIESIGPTNSRQYKVFVYFTLFYLLSRMIESIGPTNTRRYKVAVYFKGERLATGTGHSIQQAEMNAAYNSLKERSGKFEILWQLLKLPIKMFYLFDVKGKHCQNM